MIYLRLFNGNNIDFPVPFGIDLHTQYIESHFQDNSLKHSCIKDIWLNKNKDEKFGWQMVLPTVVSQT